MTLSFSAHKLQAIHFFETSEMLQPPWSYQDPPVEYSWRKG